MGLKCCAPVLRHQSVAMESCKDTNTQPATRQSARYFFEDMQAFLNFFISSVLGWFISFAKVSHDHCPAPWLRRDFSAPTCRFASIFFRVIPGGRPSPLNALMPACFRTCSHRLSVPAPTLALTKSNAVVVKSKFDRWRRASLTSSSSRALSRA